MHCQLCWLAQCRGVIGYVQQALAERNQLQDQNAQLQHRLAEVFHQRAAEDTHRDEHVSATADQDKRYLNYMGQLLILPSYHLHQPNS